MATVTAKRKQIASWYRTLPQWAWWVVAVGIALGLVSPQPFLSLAGWAVLPVLVRLTWRKGEPPIALVGVVKLWVISVGPVLYFAGIQGLPLEEVAGTYPSRFSTLELDTACWLSLGATLMVATGVRLGLSLVPPVPWQRLRTEVHQLDPEKLLLAYGGAYAFNLVFGGGGLLSLGGLAQFAIALTLIRWAFFFLLAGAVLFQHRKYRLLVLAIVIEVTFGLLGYWGSFKDFFFIFAIAYVTARPKVTAREARVLIAVFLMVFTLGLFWQAVKPQYRAFLTRGEVGGMSAEVSYTEQVEKMWQLAQTTGWSDLTNSMGSTVERITVPTFFFGEVVEYIPEHRPYDGGTGWKRGVEHILKPRILFPDKPVINDSEITNRYIGGTVTEEGASFSIGYFGESYADFGPFLMYVPIFLVGVMLGLMYRFFIVRPRIKIIGFSFAAAFLTSRIGGLDDIPSMLGLSITRFVVMAAVLYVAEAYLYKWLQR
ncbi:hypothetical protein [Salinibacter sp.]|uniref:hypothetical protein n=1 Tax=Salinibacter sp. TaxID=2065818 RepID=UPI0021E819B1|nr:hypothetical protein [Salinibacter sp.]